MSKISLGKEQVSKFGAIMTPPWVVDKMLDMLSPETWTDPNVRLCEPSVGTGNFIAGMLSRLMQGLEGHFPDPVQRYAWIFEHILYAVDIQPDMIQACIVRFSLQNLNHHFIVANFLTMDVPNWRA